MDPVYIIESPSPVDLFEGRNEGGALSKALKLSGCKTSCWLVTNDETLKKAFHSIASDFGIDHPTGQMKSLYLHISAHGNDEGLCLTNGSFISWKNLSSLLKILSELIGSEHAEDNIRVSRIILCLSSCSGLSSKNMYEANALSSIQAIVGPNKEVAWPDALTAFTTFYHLVNLKDLSVPVAVEKMNCAAGLDGVFVGCLSPEVTQLLTR